MCGIAGFVGRGDKTTLEAMLACLVHRGPDGDGIHVDEEHAVHLGHRRLAILDLAGGAQPMWNEDSTVGVTFNGEIYNHRPLRAELTAAGHRFRTDHADTEVLVHGWEQWGPGLLERLNGMFAFAVYDRRRRRLLLARDRFGEKPLFYGRRAGAFVFASELTALLRHPALADATIDARALQKFFAHGFFPAPNTPYEAIRKLPQGHYLEVDVDAVTVTAERCYWRFALVRDAPPAGGPDSWARTLEDLLDRAVAGRLESDVPLGIFLSGGIDSSAILSLAADARPAQELDTFSIGFTEPSFDESGPAARVAAHVGSNHHTDVCDLEGARSLLFDVLSRLDEPLGDPSILPTYLLARFARRHVTVALSGDGGDELFAGYDPFRALRLVELYERWIPRPVHRAVSLIAARLPISDRNMSLDFRLRRGLRAIGHPPSIWNPVWIGALGPREIADLFGSPLDTEDLYSEAIGQWDASAGGGLVERTMEFYTNLYLSDDILVKTDRASMLNSLEVRAPFLDNDVVAFVQRLPVGVKLRGGETKWILKRALARRLPREILARPKKGFGIPLSRWLRELDLETAGRAVPRLDDARWRRLLQEHRARERDHRGALWCWLALRLSLHPSAHRVA